MTTKVTRDLKIKELEDKLKQIEKCNQLLTNDLNQVREHNKIRTIVQAEELRRATAHCDKLDRTIDKMRKHVEIATQRVQQVEKEAQVAQEKNLLSQAPRSKRKRNKTHKLLAKFHSIF